MEFNEISTPSVHNHNHNRNRNNKTNNNITTAINQFNWKRFFSCKCIGESEKLVWIIILDFNEVKWKICYHEVS